jgi:hypothetical protein
MDFHLPFMSEHSVHLPKSKFVFKSHNRGEGHFNLKTYRRGKSVEPIEGARKKFQRKKYKGRRRSL